MAKLIIVESPAKAKTIEKYLGKDFNVIASVGHIRDLPKTKLGVDVEHDFEPLYVNMKDKTSVIRELKSKAKLSEAVYLATDPDREGEAISWHLATILDLDASEPIRVSFSEITKNGIKSGMANPRSVDMDLVNAQQARRILDRIVGYKLSPFLWKKVRRGLSAGRVQSVAVRIIVDREKEIEAFITHEYWSIDGKFASGKSPKKPFDAKLIEIDGKKIEIPGKGDENSKDSKANSKAQKIEIATKEQADEILANLANAVFVVSKVKKSKRKKQPAPPFTTSTMQQEASGKLSFVSKRTMKVAQELYEGVNVPGHGAVGLITYMRTDSLRISEEARSASAALISQLYGKEYLPDKPRFYKEKKGAQDGHEAIRPTIIEITPEQVKSSLTSDQYRLYKLIWERFMASQMADAVLNTVSVDITAKEYLFRASGYTVAFDGFTKLYDKDTDSPLPELTEGENPVVSSMAGNQHFTQPPPRYNEASLIKALEENGIGRPSTYAPTISTILDRQYVEKLQKQLKPTILGCVITDLFKEHFSNIVDTKFTAQMETDLDKVEDGEQPWVNVLKEFYGDFEQTLAKAESEMEGKRVKIPTEPTDETCDLCGRGMEIKIGRFGKFMSCSGFPDCKGTKGIVQTAGGDCPNCGKKMLAKKSKKGKTFFACEDYTDCKFITWDSPVPERCPQCNCTLFKKIGKDKKVYCAKQDCGYLKP
ncbi:MAG: type I DNA topoisomerase [Oscillospiraceae bacterium]|nr:type I DNA topoisomerase [Oscillospiraceae bacterium]